MNDAKGCYNRIDYNFAILVLMFFGVPWIITRILFRVLQQARHRIKTGYGVSWSVYGNDDKNEPIAGIGQSNVLGPSLWCLISTIIIKKCKKGHGTTITTPTSKKILPFFGFAFVYNADLVTTANKAYKSDAEMIQKMQTLMTKWCDCIPTTGGPIASAKTRWLLVSFFWNGNDWEYETKDSLPGNIPLPDKDRNVYTVNREEPTTAFESLGIQIDPVNTSSKALDDVTLICQEYSTQMNNAKCNQTSCLNAFNTSFMLTLSYRMIATQFTEQKWNKTICPANFGDLNEECIGRSNSKHLCDKFGLVNIFHGKFPNYVKFKTYQEGFKFIDYGLIYKDLIDKVVQVTYERFGYRKGKGDHRGWYFDI